MDNVPFHKSRIVQETIEEAGHTCLHLPPYSPHLNAAEWVFGNVKTHVRRQDLEDQETLCGHINNGIRRDDHGVDSRGEPELCHGQQR
jgi:transposase